MEKERKLRPVRPAWNSYEETCPVHPDAACIKCQRLCFYFMAFPQLSEMQNPMSQLVTDVDITHWDGMPLLQIISHHNKQVTFLLLLTKLWWYSGMWSVSPGQESVIRMFVLLSSSLRWHLYYSGYLPPSNILTLNIWWRGHRWVGWQSQYSDIKSSSHWANMTIFQYGQTGTWLDILSILSLWLCVRCKKWEE